MNTQTAEAPAKNQGEERKRLKADNLREQARLDGIACATAGGKMKSNPHEGGSPQWWSWHEAYKATKAKIEAEKRRSA